MPYSVKSYVHLYFLCYMCIYMYIHMYLYMYVYLFYTFVCACAHMFISAVHVCIPFVIYMYVWLIGFYTFCVFKKKDLHVLHCISRDNE